MKDDLLDAAKDGFVGAFGLAAALVCAAPIAIYVVARNFIREEPFNPLMMLHGSPPPQPDQWVGQSNLAHTSAKDETDDGSSPLHN